MRMPAVCRMLVLLIVHRRSIVFADTNDEPCQYLIKIVTISRLYDLFLLGI